MNKVVDNIREMPVDQLLEHCSKQVNDLTDLELELSTRLSVAMEIIRLDQECSIHH